MLLAAADLSSPQREVVAHRGAPLLVLGAAGTGKTEALLARVRQGDGALLLGSTEGVAHALRRRGASAATGPRSFSEELLRSCATAAGLDPFFAVAGRADRVALLLDNVDEMELELHDFRGRPSALMAAFVARIDRLKERLVDAATYAHWAAADGDTRQREFARIFAAHDRMLAREGLVDGGDLLLLAIAALRADTGLLERTRARHREVLVDDLHRAAPATAALVELLCPHAVASAAPGPAASAWAQRVGAAVVELKQAHRCPRDVAVAADAVLAGSAPVPTAPDGGSVRFVRCESERAQIQAVAADLERLLLREKVEPERVAVIVDRVDERTWMLADALSERAVGHRVVGASDLFGRVVVRDVLAWLRLLVDPRDAPAVVRALARPPVELRGVDLARVIQIARRRKLDMVSAVAAATESPQLPSGAQDRLAMFLKICRGALEALDPSRADVFVHRLVERLGLRRQQLFAARPDVVAGMVALGRLTDLAADAARRLPHATARDFARQIAVVADVRLPPDDAELDAPQAGEVPHERVVRILPVRACGGDEFDHVFVLGMRSATAPDEPIEEGPSAGLDGAADDQREALALAITRCAGELVLVGSDGEVPGALEDARAALGVDWEECSPEALEGAQTLPETLRRMRDEVLDDVARVGRRLGELRLDTDVDISHGVARYLELVKLSTLVQRPDGQSVADALSDVNARLLAACTSLQREILQTSSLDDLLLAAEHDERARARAVAARDEPTLEPFLPKRGDGLLLSASDIDTYRACPLRYKFARVFRIPTEPTLHQRFGILIHQVLERYHAAGAQSLREMEALLESGWRRGGFGDGEQERQLHEKARRALTRYHERIGREGGEPVWFERSFEFRLGPHRLRGRVDRVDRLSGDGEYELIDYKTGVPRTPAELRDDVQLTLYAIGAREDWRLEASRQSYYYVLDDEKVPLPDDAPDRQWLQETVLEVADGILAQGFEPTPSPAACATCDFRITCPAAES